MFFDEINHSCILLTKSVNILKRLCHVEGKYSGLLMAAGMYSGKISRR